MKSKCCGKFSSVYVDGDTLVFKIDNENYSVSDREKIFYVDEIKSNKFYKTFTVGNNSDGFIKVENKIIFTYVRNMDSEASDRMWFGCYDLKDKMFKEISLNGLFNKINVKEVMKNVNTGK